MCTLTLIHKVTTSGVTRLLLMPWQSPGKLPTHAAHIHMSILIIMDISILFKICCTSYSACNIYSTLKIQNGRNDPLTMVVLPRNSNNRFLGSSNCK